MIHTVLNKLDVVNSEKEAKVINEKAETQQKKPIPDPNNSNPDTKSI